MIILHFKKEDTRSAHLTAVGNSTEAQFLPLLTTGSLRSNESLPIAVGNLMIVTKRAKVVGDAQQQTKKHIPSLLKRS